MTDKIDKTDKELYTYDELRQVADAAAQSAVSLIMPRLANLDNIISNTMDISKKETKDMSIERRRVIIGYNDDGTPILKQISATNCYEMNDRIVETYICSGRISEFVGVGAKRNTETFKEYADKWFDTYISHKKPSTIATYKKILKAIYPDLGDIRLSDIKTDDIQRYLNKYQDMSKKTLKERLARIAQILDSAIEDKLITSNPAKSRRIVVPSDRAEEREAIPLDVMRTVISKSAHLDLKDRLLLLLLITTGGRRGEVLGLQWQDVDTVNNVIHIRRNVTHATGNVPIVGTPKTKSGVRDVPYDASIRSLIDPTGKRPDAFIISGSAPTEAMTMSMYNNTWSRIQKKIPELGDYSAHYFRHTYATLLSEYTDASPKTIQTLAGHKDIRTTMSIYEHACKEKVAHISDEMHNLLFT